MLPSVRSGSACCPVFRINIAPSTGITAELRIDCSSSFTPSFNFFLRFRSGFAFSKCKKVRAICIKHCVYKKLFYFNYILLRKDTYSIRDVSTSSLDKNKLPSKQNHNWLKTYLKYNGCVGEDTAVVRWVCLVAAGPLAVILTGVCFFTGPAATPACSTRLPAATPLLPTNNTSLSRI